MKENEMAARIVVTEFVSLDGVMEAPGGEPGFKYPGWQREGEFADKFNSMPKFVGEGIAVLTYERSSR